MRQIIEEEEGGRYDWGEDKEVVVPFMMHKPQVELSSSREPSAGTSDGDGDDDNVPVRQEEPIGKEKKKRRISDMAGMIRGLRVDTDSPYWESQKGELPATEGMGSIGF